MKKKLMLLLMVLAVVGSALAACTTPVKVTLDKTTLDIFMGQTARLEATVEGGGTVTWSSSDTAIVAVTQNGTIQGKKTGTATITAAVGDAKATCTVNVSANAEIAKAKYFLLSGETAATNLKTASVGVTFAPDLSDNDTVTWTSSKESVVTVAKNAEDFDAVITAVGAGTATITVTASNGATATAEVEVEALVDEPAEVTFVVYTPAELPSWVVLALRGNNFGWDGSTHLMTRDATNAKKWTFTANWDFDQNTSLERGVQWKVVLSTKNLAGEVTDFGWTYEMKKSADNENLTFLANGGKSTVEYNVEFWSGIPDDPDEVIPPFDLEVTLTVILKEATELDMYMRGSITGADWALNEDFKFTKDATNPLKYTLTFTIEQAMSETAGPTVSFKILLGDDWSNELFINDGNNIMIKYREGKDTGKIAVEYNNVEIKK